MHFSHLICFLILSPSIYAQKSAAADSMWCAHLNDIIRCVSMKQILEPVAKVSVSVYIDPLTPDIRLSKAGTEVIYKKDGKVAYVADIKPASGSKEDAIAALRIWHKKIKSCLDLWAETRLANYDKSVSDQDYFFTNSEDETSVRVSIMRDHGYRVRITIY